MKARLKSNVTWWISALVLVLSCLVTLAVFEWTMQTSLMREEVKILKDPDHRMPANDEGKGTNSDGLRSKIDASEIGEDDFTILFLGDSFVYGYLLERESSIPYKLERMLQAAHPDRQVRVVNAGWMSASPFLALRLLKELGAKYKPDLVLYGFDMTDFRDDIMYRNMLEKPGIWKLGAVVPALFVLSNKAAKKLAGVFQMEAAYRTLFKMPSERYFISRAPWQTNEIWLSGAKRNLDELNRFCRERLNVPFALIVFPRSYQYSNKECPHNWEKDRYDVLGRYALEPFKYFEHLKSKVDYPIYTLLETFKNTTVFPTTFLNDPHYNDAGTSVAAQAIFTRIKKDFPIAPTETVR